MKKGFTLVELLAVIVILAIILSIAVPGISSLIDSTKLNAYLTDENMMVKATKNYIGINDSYLPVNIGDSKEIKLSDLQSNNYIGVITDPKDKSVTCDGYVLVTKTGTSSYDYTPYLKCSDGLIANGYTNDKLVAIYKLDGNAYDYSPNAKHGTISGALPTTNRFGEVDKAMTFDGTDDYIALANEIVTVDNIRTNGITYCAWIKPNSNATQRIVGQQISSGYSDYSSGGLGISSGYAQMIAYSDANPSGYIYATGTTTLETGKWYYIVGTFDQTDSKIRIYVNGKLEGTPQTIGTFSRLIANVSNRIGIKDPATYPYNGAVDDVVIYNRALSQKEIEFNYNVEK